MSIETHPGKKTIAPPAPVNWGEVIPEGQRAQVIRFVLSDRVVTYPLHELHRWEHTAGETECLTISAGKEEIVVEGHELARIRAALDLGRLVEVRVNFTRTSAGRPGPCISRIAIEPA